MIGLKFWDSQRSVGDNIQFPELVLDGVIVPQQLRQIHLLFQSHLTHEFLETLVIYEYYK